ncbi:helix-turn-helix domain-containing protein [Azospirillum sp. TSO35-2]|uniref:helix-turn-helix domain-containing protein n=1 Tax=Azospirillum sp. TSO35-2 TaxID=716796 RepID=UPI000D65E608|nr:helix-turn-helix domain-containing protein [Azospirillum sp. TSO35-2]
MTEQHFCLVGEEVKEPYHYTGCGLDGIYLVNGYDVLETEYGQGVSIKNVDGLLDAIADYLVQSKKDLAGKEIRFLRTRMDITQSELGRLLGMSTQQVARWEKDKSEIPGPADRLLRLLYAEHSGKGINIRAVLQILDEFDSSRANRAMFEPDESGEHWRRAAA